MYSLYFNKNTHEPLSVSRIIDGNNKPLLILRIINMNNVLLVV